MKKNKKVGIVTIIDNDNYGNRLQNYALQEVIKKMGFDSITLKNEKRINNKNGFFKSVRNILSAIKNWIRILIKSDKDRLNSFKRFNKENMKFNKVLITPYSKYLDKKYYKFIVGSDQVWKPLYKRMSDVDFLCFASDDKKISYAASFGIDEIPEKYTNKLKNGVQGFEAVSVREERGKEILKEIANKEADIVLDPTLLLDKNDWEKIEKKPSFIGDKKYILTYFLGDNVHNDSILKLANINNMEIINIMDKNSKFYKTGPAEFLYLFNHASLILTDSFHACVFSIIYSKPFYVFDRVQEGMNNMNSRLETLLSKFELQSRKINIINDSKEIFECDYSNTFALLKEEQKKSLDFLKKALDIN